MPDRGIPLPSASAASWGTLWPMNLGKPTGLPFRRFLETSEPRLELLRQLQLASGQVGGPILMESGMRHRKVNQFTRSHHCRCINERSHTASPLLLLPCTAASSLLACWFGPCRRNPNSSSKKQLGFCCGKEVTRETHVHP